MRRRLILSGMLMLVCVLACCSAAAGTAGTEGALTWTLTDDGTLTVAGEGRMWSADGWQEHAEEIRRIVIREGVTDLCYGAFSGCGKAESIQLPDSLIQIGSYAFASCTGLKEITLPKGLLYIRDGAFSGCENLTDISFSNGLREIGGGAFSQCTGLTEIVLPDSVTSIGNGAFFECSGLRTVRLPDGLKQLSDSTFYGCENLKTVHLPAQLTVIGRAAFEWCHALNGVSFPEGLTSIGSEAFFECSSLTEVLLPDSVSWIGREAFRCCYKLRKLRLSRSLSCIEEELFESCYELDDVVIPDCVTRIQENAFSWCSSLNHFVVPASVTEIDGIIVGPQSILTVEEGSYAQRYAEKNGLTVRILNSGEKERTGAASLQAKIDEIIANEIEPGMSDYRKAVVLHNWLVRNVEYDYTYTHYWASDALLEGTSVCQGYTDAYSLLLDAVGIENDFGHGTNHIWNVVLLEGSWCHIDVTWDDGGEPEYFGVTNFALQDQSSHEYFNRDHECDDYTLSYAYRSGKLDQVADSWAEKMAGPAAGGETDFQIEDGGFGTVYGNMTIQMLNDTGITLDGVYYPVRIERGEGYTLHIMLNAGERKDAESGILLGEHRLIWEEGKEATCTDEGAKACWKCADCGKLFNGTGALRETERAERIPRKAHEWEFHERMEPNCSEAGTEAWVRCTVCGLMADDSEGLHELQAPTEIPRREHEGKWELKETREEGWLAIKIYTRKCRNCGETETKSVRASLAPMTGDVNGDGVIDGRDALRLMKWLAGEDENGITESNADINLDGEVDERDLIRLMKILAGEAEMETEAE